MSVFLIAEKPGELGFHQDQEIKLQCTFSQRSSVGAFAVYFRVLSRQKYTLELFDDQLIFSFVAFAVNSLHSSVYLLF